MTKLNEAQTANKKKLEEFTKQLRRLKLPVSPISMELADYVASALESYFDGRTKTLETAFGLNAGKGTKGYRPEFNRQRAERVINARVAGKTWDQITQELGGKDGLPNDKRELQRLADEFRAEILAEHITLEDLFSEDDDPERP